MNINNFITLSILTLATSYPTHASAEPLTGERSSWHGFDRYDFQVTAHDVLVVVPQHAAAGRPWVWHGEYFGHQPEADIALLGRGFHIVYMKMTDQFGSPYAVERWNQLYERLTGKHGFSKRPALIGLSRGGLYCYNWAAQNPGKTACIFGDAPVCDLRSWPAGLGNGTGNAAEHKRLKAVYAVSTDEQLFAKALNPIDHLKPLADARVPLMHIYGDADKGVPWDENTGIVADRYRKLGGQITLIAKPGVGHVHGLDDATPIIEFIEQHSRSRTRKSSGDNQDSAPKSGDSGYEQPDNTPLAIGSRRELFVDRFLIGRLSNARLRLNPPRTEEIILRMDQPHEGPFAGYTTVIKDGSKYRLYYRGISKLTPDGSEHERTCYAESDDGIHWVKPKLGLYEFNGTKANNIVLADAAPATHNLCPMLDTKPGVAAAERYKAVGGTGKELFAFVSPDGIHWKRMQEQPILASKDIPFEHIHLFDSQNLTFWSASEQTYVCYFRVWDGLRRISRTTSPDFRRWSPAVLMRQIHDDGIHGPEPAPDEHLYTNQTSPYFRASHIYTAMAARFFEGRQVISAQQAKEIGVHPQYFNDTSDSIFMTSRGGDVYDRTFLEGYLKPAIGARNWVSRTNYPALNVVQTGPTEMSFYVNHDTGQPTAHLRRYSLRLDGFASVSAGAKAGELLTKPFTFSGDSLKINFATSAGGSLRCELQDADGNPIPGFELTKSDELIGNEIERTVRWQGSADVRPLSGQTVRLRFELKDADLFAIQFTGGSK